MKSLLISIPAPARGATCSPFSSLAVLIISIPAPARGATRLLLAGCLTQLISIPAPARGATRVPCDIGCHHKHFNSRPCARGDRLKIFHSKLYNYFNSRPCARGDLKGPKGDTGPRDFNSRPCARGDLVESDEFKLVVTFQFPPLREGRLSIDICTKSLFLISIPAPARGAT